MGKKFSGTLGIKIGTIGPMLLSDAMLRDNTTVKERTDFSVTNKENTTGTLYKTNKTEDSSDVYYYSGNTTNNWVKFGKYTTSDTTNSLWNSGDDMYWRIIRTNEDGSVRLLYAGTGHDTTKGYIGKSEFNSPDDAIMYVGYMYGTSGSLANNRTNENDSTIKTFIDTWYKNNLLNDYDKYISKTAIYCNDRSVGSGTYNTGSTAFYYGGYTRLYTNKTPSYKCGANTSDGLFESTQATADKFSASTTGGGNGQLKYPIALMTADEISFAGGKILTELSSPYAWYYTNSATDPITDTSWWLLSPSDWGDVYHSSSNAFFVSASSCLFFISYTDDSAAVRPVISLSSCVKVLGIGTPEDPYVVDYDNSCK